MSFIVNTKLQDAIKQVIALMVEFPAIYWVVSALRGPDEGGYSSNTVTAKYPSTGRIRGFLYGNESGIPGSKQITPLTSEQQKQRDDFLAKSSERFRNHFNKAVTVIKDAFGYDLMTETDLTLPPPPPPAPAKPKVNAELAAIIGTIVEAFDKNPNIAILIESLRSADTCQGSKLYTTGRLRGFLNKEYGVILPGSDYQIPLTVEQMTERDALLATEAEHYQNYYLAAVQTVKEVFGYDLMTETVVV